MCGGHETGIRGYVVTKEKHTVQGIWIISHISRYLIRLLATKVPAHQSTWMAVLPCYLLQYCSQMEAGNDVYSISDCWLFLFISIYTIMIYEYFHSCLFIPPSVHHYTVKIPIRPYTIYLPTFHRLTIIHGLYYCWLVVSTPLKDMKDSWYDSSQLTLNRKLRNIPNHQLNNFEVII